MPLAYGAGTLAEHRACRHDAGGLRRQPSGHRPGRGRRTPSIACRPPCPTTSARWRPGGPSTPICSTITTARWSTTSSSGGLPTRSSTSCPTPPTPRRVRRGRRREGHHRLRGASSPCRARTPEPAGDHRPRGRGGAPLRGRPVRRGRGWPASAAGTGYTGEDGVECAVPADAADSLWTALLATGIQPAGLGRPRHAPPRGRPAPARPRARPGHHPLAGRAGLGGRLGQGGVPGPGRAGGRARARRRAAVWSGSPPTAASPRAEGSAVVSDGLGRRARSPAGTSLPCSERGIALALLDTAVTGRNRAWSVDVEQRGRLPPGHGRDDPVRAEPASGRVTG